MEVAYTYKLSETFSSSTQCQNPKWRNHKNSRSNFKPE